MATPTNRATCQPEQIAAPTAAHRVTSRRRQSRSVTLDACAAASASKCMRQSISATIVDSSMRGRSALGLRRQALLELSRGNLAPRWQGVPPKVASLTT
eukprot:4965394-Pyramimonas_sp.AAC.1